MRRRLAQRTKIAGRRGKWAAKVKSPEAVHNHASRERIRRIGDCFGQLAPSAAAGERLRLALAKHAQKMPRHQRSFVRDTAANENVKVSWLAVADDMHRLLGILRFA